jgi:AcrR family transcriptional regulator
VAEKAGISIGSFYQYFPNKDALLSELMRRHIEEIERGVEEMAVHAATMPLEQLIRVAIGQNINAHLIDPELHRVLSEEVPLAGLTNWKATYAKRMHERVRAAFELRHNEIRVPDLDLAVYMVTSAVEAVVHNGVSARAADVKSGALAAELARMLVGYLTGRATLPQRVEKGRRRINHFMWQTWRRIVSFFLSFPLSFPLSFVVLGLMVVLTPERVSGFSIHNVKSQPHRNFGPPAGMEQK